MRTILLRVAMACACVVALAGQQPPATPPAAQQGQQQQPPVFRTGVKLVRVDATVTGRQDRPVADLQASDFEIAEDGIPQRVEQVQFVKLDGRRPAGDDTSLSIRSQTQAEAEAARDDVRVFAIFLDDYHIDKAPEITIPMRRGLSEFVRRLWPTDLVAVMEPLTTLSALKFTRSLPELIQIVQSFEGRQGELFPIKSAMEEAQWSRGNIRRVRAEVTLSALAALTVRLAGLREGRKTILFVSQGPPTYLGPREGNLQDLMRDVTEAANRGNVTIYTLDPRLLGDDYRMGVRDTLFQLAAETGGRAIVNTNDMTIGLTKMLAETSAYYVLGYTPTRSEDDGKYHKISVKVKRSGVRVLARQGYWAPSTKEMEAAAEAANKFTEPTVARALDTESNTRATKRLASVWMGMARGADGKTALSLVWEPSESASGQTVATLDAEIQQAAGLGPIRLPALAPTAAGRPIPATSPTLVTPGEARIRFVAKSPGGVVLDDWAEPLTIEDFAAPKLALSTPRAYLARTFADWKALQAAPDSQPAPVWQFRRTERVAVAASVYVAEGEPTLEVHVLTREGKELTALPVSAVTNGQIRFELPVGSFGQGTYLLRIRAKAGGNMTERVTAFRLIP